MLVKKTYLGCILVFLFLIVQISCTNNNTGNKKYTTTNFDSLASPVTVIATNPRIVLTDTCPAPKNIIVPAKPTNQTIALKNGKTLKLMPPEVKPAGFVSLMQNYTTEQGLALDALCSSFIDKRGNLWFGTAGGGVSRYDGKSFTNYNTAQGISTNEVWCITEDKTGNMWYTTYSL